jgi:hypothetical protein
MEALPPTAPRHAVVRSQPILTHTEDDDWHEAWSRQHVDPEDPYRNAPIGSPYSDD